MKKAPIPRENNGSILLRFVANDGTRYSLSCGHWDNEEHMTKAMKLSKIIFDDFTNDIFDATLKRYRDYLGITPKAPKPPPTAAPKLLTQRESWGQYLLDRQPALNAHHRIINKALTPEWSAAWLLEIKEKYSQVTYNNLRSFLIGFERYYAEQEHHSKKLYSVLGTKKKTLKDAELGKRYIPFTTEELGRIISFFKEPKLSPQKNTTIKHYYPFVAMLASTGMRPGEVIGLRPIDIDWDNGVLRVSESMSPVKIDGEDTGRRARKTCKAGETKVIPIPPVLQDWLQSRCQRNPELLFTSPRCNMINFDSFSRTAWKPVLTALGIPYRVPYALRHTFASHAIAQGIPLTEIAAILGHSDLEMLSKHYGKVTKQPSLPTMF